MPQPPVSDRKILFTFSRGLRRRPKRSSSSLLYLLRDYLDRVGRAVAPAASTLEENTAQVTICVLGKSRSAILPVIKVVL